MARLLVAGAVLAAAGAPLLAGDQYVLHVLIMWGIYGILTLGLNVINGFAGQLSLGQGAFYGIGAYGAAILTVRAGWSFWVATPAATVLAALVGMLVALPVLRVRGIYLGMATFGFAEIVHVVLRSWESLTKGVLGMAGILPPIALGIDFGTQDRFYYLVLAGLLLSVLLSHRIYQSLVGHALLAIRDDELAASLLGINTTAHKVAAFGAAAGLAGLAGSLFAHYLTYISPENFTSVESILIVTMLIVGGRGNTLGAVVGAGLLVALPELLRVVNVYRLLIYGLLLVGAAVFRPDGLVGQLGRGRRRARPVAAPLPGPAGAGAAAAPLLRVEDLRVQFGGLVALDDVSFSVARGEVYGIIGPNGAGKTTLFNAITGVAPVARGRLRLGDRELGGLAPYRRARAGIAPDVPEHPGVRRDAGVGNRGGGLPRAPPARRARAPLRDAGRPGRGGRRPESGRRVAPVRRAGGRRRAARAEPALRPPATARDRPRAGHRAAAPAPGRAGRRHERERVRGADRPDPAHPRPGRDHSSGRAPHAGRDGRLGSHPRPELRSADRGRDAGGRSARTPR